MLIIILRIESSDETQSPIENSAYRPNGEPKRRASFLWFRDDAGPRQWRSNSRTARESPTTPHSAVERRRRVLDNLSARSGRTQRREDRVQEVEPQSGPGKISRVGAPRGPKELARHGLRKAVRGAWALGQNFGAKTRIAVGSADCRLSPTTDTRHDIQATPLAGRAGVRVLLEPKGTGILEASRRMFLGIIGLSSTACGRKTAFIRQRLVDLSPRHCIFWKAVSQ